MPAEVCDLAVEKVCDLAVEKAPKRPTWLHKSKEYRSPSQAQDGRRFRLRLSCGSGVIGVIWGGRGTGTWPAKSQSKATAPLT